MKKNLKKDYSKLADVRVLQRIVDDTGYVDAKNTEGINVSNSKLNRKKKLTKKNITKAPVKNIRRAYKELQKFTEDNITLYKDRLNVEKRLSVPPRQGLVYDEAKSRWTRPDKVGQTVSEIQGYKRIRGTGTGTHQRAISTKAGMRRYEAMRRFREAGERRRGKIGRKGVSLKRFLARVKRRKAIRRKYS
tara:strand:+ start:961 stop:1530 length:570 start_codon:yes stop_codon:yes gene_type:complete